MQILSGMNFSKSSNNQSNINFKAKIGENLKDALFKYCDEDLDKFKKVNKKIDELEKCGEPDTELNYVFSAYGRKHNIMMGNTEVDVHFLTLSNPKIREMRTNFLHGVDIKRAYSLKDIYKSFVSLNESDIIKKENELFERSNPFTNPTFNVDYSMYSKYLEYIKKTTASLSVDAGERYNKIVQRHFKKTDVDKMDSYSAIEAVKKEISSKVIK